MKITDEVYMLDCVKYAHVFLIKGEENILIDTGMPGHAKKILAELKTLGLEPCDIKAIFITHHDLDHIGNAKPLQEATNAEIIAPRDDIPYINGIMSRPGVKHVFDALLKKKTPCGIKPVEENRNYPEIKSVYAPGHTPGHTIFQFRDVVFCGDLCRNRHGSFELLPDLITWDSGKVKESVSLLKELCFMWLCPSHGEPLRTGKKLEAFLNEF